MESYNVELFSKQSYSSLLVCYSITPFESLLLRVNSNILSLLGYVTYVTI